MGLRHKTLYVIRHGETSSNVNGQFQGSDEPLTERGREQAAALAARLSSDALRYPIDLLLSSSDRRAYETATIIRGAYQNPPQLTLSSLFVERRHPTKIWGKSASDKEAMAIHAEARARFHDPGFTYDDGETFGMLKKRVLMGIAYILRLPYRHIALVTHGVYGTALAAATQRGSALTSHDLNAYQFRLNNTGLSILGYETRTNFSETGEGWVILGWNDTTHLG